MSAMKGIMRRAILSGVVGAAVVAAVGVARGDVASDKPGAILVFPKIVVDTSGVLGAPTDTEIQITNTSNSLIGARCFLVDGTSHCSNYPTQACTAACEADPSQCGPGYVQCPAGGTCCAPGSACNNGGQLTETDFRMTLTKRQPVSWKASEGLPYFPLPSSGPNARFGPFGQTNGDSSAPGVQEDPFVGELKCVEVDPTNYQPTIGFNPANNAAGDLKGEATIVSAYGPESVDARKYNAIGIPANSANFNPVQNADGSTTLTLQGSGASGGSYGGCPNVLILNHLFDGAVVTADHGQPIADVNTDLTVVPCSEDFSHQECGDTVLQFLVYNEFEQRFSTSTRVPCWWEEQLSDIDSRPGNLNGNNSYSIFNVYVQGTLSGQTRIRAVSGTSQANTILGISEQFLSGPGPMFSTAADLHFTGTRDLPDYVVLSPQ